ncbi:hypothetical protein [Crateriforma conspicua]|uniref:PEP-CTERM sorting domain-containing protein n=1 Tax=Crateriforma conspicua TaxID=2527996 RepID=A0A5C5Y7T5_9PLAN|nr:hypothetical protein [Crateriforma conspicua]QDV65147.1 hypothetical protein Mal65_43170 [Crateriforma conspicua]TWT70541.1 hypothetical protein Pan14r_28480 [Crateriforma conspicua]
MTRLKVRIASLAIAGLMACAPSLQAQTITGQDDFGDSWSGNTPTGGNQVFTSRTITPDNSGNFGFWWGIFGGSNFDYYGITDRRINFDVADDSAGTFPIDQFGFASSLFPNDNFVAIADLANNDNLSGLAFADWQFDISAQGASPFDVHRISLTMVAYGDFESGDDNVVFSGGVTGQPSATFFDFGLSAAQDAADTLYQVTMEAGGVYDFYFQPSAFFDVNEWNNLVLNGPSGSVTYHPNDNGGADDDGTAFNGFIAEPTFSDPAGVTRAYTDGSFDEQEIEAFKDPMVEQISGVQLDNQMQQFTAVVKGVGTTFDLNMTAAQNASFEIMAYDNILLESAVLGDANGDLTVDTLDISPFALALVDRAAYELANPGIDPDFVLDFNCDGVFDSLDIAPFGSKLASP